MPSRQTKTFNRAIPGRRRHRRRNGTPAVAVAAGGGGGAWSRPARGAPEPGEDDRIASLFAERVAEFDRAQTSPTAESDTAPPAVGKYVYCIVRAPKPLRFGAIGLGAQPSAVYTVNYKDLAAVVSDAPVGVQDPTRENVLAHQRVNETVMRDHTVLPMSFGTVFKTRDDILELLRSAHDAFCDVLGKMRNKVELGLKVLWDRDAIIREIEREDEDLRRLKAEISAQKGSTYFARMQFGRLVDGALQARSERYVGEIFAALRDVSVASRSNKPIGDKMILNAAFLVSRDKEAAFDARLKATASRYPNVTFRYTGPWPPYNFVNIRLKLEWAK